MQLYLLYLQIIPTFVPNKSNPIINKTSTAVMKKKTILFASCLLGALAFSSCEKNLYDESKQPEKEKKMTDLEVPADFDWKGSQNAKVKIASQSTATISVFLEENCNEEALMLRMDVDANTSKLELPIEIPAYIKNVYLLTLRHYPELPQELIKKLKRTTSSIIRDMATELLCSKICIQL